MENLEVPFPLNYIHSIFIERVLNGWKLQVTDYEGDIKEWVFNKEEDLKETIKQIFAMEGGDINGRPTIQTNSSGVER